MNDPIDQHMQEVLDGVATQEERAALENRLANDPALRARFEEMREVFSALGRVPLAEPPADIHQELMRAIENEARDRTDGNWLHGLAGAFRTRPVPAYALTIVSVAAIGLLVWTGMSGGPDADRKSLPVTGTMAPSDGAVPVDQHTLRTGNAELRIETLRQGDRLIADLRSSGPGGGTVVLSFDPSALRFTGPDAARKVEAFHSGPGRIEFRVSGDAHHRLVFEVIRSSLSPLHVSLRSEAGTVEEDVLTGPGGEGP